MKNKKLPLTTIYPDTSIIGAYKNRLHANRHVARILFDKIEAHPRIKVYYSDIVAKELVGAPQNSRDLLQRLIDTKKAKKLHFNSDIYILAMAYIKHGALTDSSKNDALHIAYASYYKMDFLLSWNMKHMVKLIQQDGFNYINTRFGYQTLRILSPDKALTQIKILIP